MMTDKVLMILDLVWRRSRRGVDLVAHTHTRRHRKTTHHTIRCPGSARGTGGLTGRSEEPGRTFDTGLHKYAQVVTSFRAYWETLERFCLGLVVVLCVQLLCTGFLLSPPARVEISMGFVWGPGGSP